MSYILAKDSDVKNLNYYGDANIVPTDATAFTYTDNGDGTCTITGFGGVGIADVIIPYEINGLTVTGIGEGAFYYKSSLAGITKIVLPNSIEYIGSTAFWGLRTLTEINIPKTVTSIDVSAFMYCEKIKRFIIPEGVQSLGYGVFGYCKDTEVEVPNSVTTIDVNAFIGCENLTIICNAGSYAESYAKENGIAYKINATYVDQTYNPESSNAQSGKAVAEAMTSLINNVTLEPDGMCYLPLSNSSTVIYNLTADRDIMFGIPLATTINFYQILVHANITAEVSINWGTSTFFNGEVPDIGIGKYDFIFEWDGTEWCAGAIEKGTVVTS